MVQNFRLGLDIGIASVGWAVVTENDTIVDAGVRLFPEGGSTSTSAERRVKRASRRLLRRRHHRIERLRKLLLEYKIIDSLDYDFYTNEITPYELRVKGLNEILTKRELAIVLLNLVKKRGIHNFEIKAKESDEEKGTKDIIIQNQKLLDGKFVCEIQLNRLKASNINLDNGAVRGKRNVFKTEDFVKEAKQILETQKINNFKITDEFIKQYIKILEGRRDYYTGPGSPSVYGWKDEEEWIEGLFGRCTYFPEEVRMCKHSYTSELFNLLNDLNNLYIKREDNTSLTKQEKVELIELFKIQNPTLNRIADKIKVKADDISGYRIDKSEKPLFTHLSTYKDINSIFNIEDIDIIDEIAKILTVYQTNDRIIEKILELGLDITDEQIERINKLSTYTGSHSLSKKAMVLILEDLLETNKNQMQLFTEKGLVSYKMDFVGKKQIPKNYIEEWILSPVVKRSIFQTINVINSVHKRYGIPTEIVIEMAREKNSEDKKKFLKELQGKNEKINKMIREYLSERSYSKEAGFFEKMRLWQEQNGVCTYSGKTIAIEDLLNSPQNFEIDHIIPRSISFDDSQNNKVLVMRDENQNKKNMSPFQYLSTIGKYEEFKSRIKASNLNRKKQENLLFEGELSKYSRKFIARNLVDTRYATREILNLLKKYYKDNEHPVKIKSVTGAMTNQIRKMWNFPKSRELSHSHHTQDALIMLMSEKIINSLKNVRDYNEGTDEKISVDLRTGEILTDNQYKELFKYEYGCKIKEFTRYRYSHYVDKKVNRQLSDETIYSTRIVKELDKKGKKEIENEYIISKHTNIYGKDNKTIKKFFEDEKKQKQLLMYHNDVKTFEKFMEVYNAYKKEINPFFAYYNEHKKFITKYAKKDDGPPVMTIKYRQSLLGNHLDLSHKYNTKNKKVVMLSIPALRADIYKKGDTYKFVTVTYLMMQDKGKYYELNSEEYRASKERKEIDASYEFQFSLYTGDIFEILQNDFSDKIKFKGINNDKRNTVEVDFIDKFNSNFIQNIKELQGILKENEVIDKYIFERRVEDKLGYKPSVEDIKEFIKNYPVSSTQKFLTIGKAIKNIRKIYVDNLGVEYDSKERFISRIYK
ncbi:type II CRISPR RNA-guided endonuclease Cas9 [Cetobacterium sp.]|uniref:type II CRISPR RNA-guided endonuclease Cas9 n=1 Tax=Cetobacterium sp. TaxID=2071632 RepID=UPI003F30F64A